jgi:hypothetical protein
LAANDGDGHARNVLNSDGIGRHDGFAG